MNNAHSRDHYSQSDSSFFACPTCPTNVEQQAQADGKVEVHVQRGAPERGALPGHLQSADYGDWLVQRRKLGLMARNGSW
jgi:hypothetical protein